MNKLAKRAFTIVELFAVIAVMSILVLITTTVYRSVQVQARDAKNADAADKVADAIKLFVAKNEHFPLGGGGSATPIGAGTECSGGLNGWASSSYVCTIGDTLIASGYLPSGFFTEISQNMKYSAIKDGSRAIMVYVTRTTGTPPVKQAMVLYSMESPSADDTAHFNAELAKCYTVVPSPYTQTTSYGMMNGTCISVQTF